MKTYSIVSSILELADAFSLPIQPHNASDYLAVGWGIHGGASWYGGAESQAEIDAIVREGWPEGARRAQALASEIGEIQGARSVRRKRCNADQGDELRIDQAMRGEWDTAWQTTHRAAAPGVTTIDLVVSWGGHCGRPSDELFWSGALMIVLTDLLENAGYRVGLTACNYAWHDMCMIACQVALKAPQEPLRADVIAGVCCHAGVFRSLGFRRMLAGQGQVASGHGCTERPALAPEGTFPEGAVIVEPVYSKEAAVREIKRVLSQITGEPK